MCGARWRAVQSWGGKFCSLCAAWLPLLSFLLFPKQEPLFSTLLLRKVKFFTFFFFFHIIGTVPVAGKYTIFNRSLKLSFECYGDVCARVTEGCSLNLGWAEPLSPACVTSWVGSNAINMLFLWFSSLGDVCRRRRCAGFQHLGVLKYLAESGHPWETFPSRESLWEVWEEKLHRCRGEAQPQPCVLASTSPSCSLGWG